MDWGIFNKSWRVSINRDGLDCFLCECWKSLGVENIQKVARKFIGNKNITANIYRIQAYSSKMYGYFCIGFIDFMLKGKTLLEYIILLSLKEYKRNDKIV